MKTGGILVFAILMFAALATSQELPQPSTAIQNHFVGAWKLVSLEAPNADGRLHKADFAHSGGAYAQIHLETSLGIADQHF